MMGRTTWSRLDESGSATIDLSGDRMLFHLTPPRVDQLGTTQRLVIMHALMNTVENEPP
jgi:hypothetical protein